MSPNYKDQINSSNIDVSSSKSKSKSPNVNKRNGPVNVNNRRSPNVMMYIWVAVGLEVVVT